jgi:hypothetical protein
VNYLPKDVISLLALEMDLITLLNFCKTNKGINKTIYKSNIFWFNKLSRDFPYYDAIFVKNSDKNIERYKLLYILRNSLISGELKYKNEYDAVSSVEYMFKDSQEKWENVRVTISSKGILWTISVCKGPLIISFDKFSEGYYLLGFNDRGSGNEDLYENIKKYNLEKWIEDGNKNEGFSFKGSEEKSKIFFYMLKYEIEKLNFIPNELRKGLNMTPKFSK